METQQTPFLSSPGHLDPLESNPAAPGICWDSRGVQAGQGKGKPQLLQSVGQHRTTTGTSQTAEILCYISLSTQRAPAAASSCTPHPDPTWKDWKNTPEPELVSRHTEPAQIPSADSLSQILCHTKNPTNTLCSSMGAGHRACPGPAGWPQNWENTEIKAPGAASPGHRSDPNKAPPGSLQRDAHTLESYTSRFFTARVLK